MTDERLEGRLRRLPGVVECSVLPEGVALRVDPAVDPRLVKARAQAVFAEIGDPRPLVLLGGAAVAAGPVRRSGRVGVLSSLRRDATPLSLTAFVIGVLLVLGMMPSAPRRVTGPTGLIPPVSDDLSDAARLSSLTPELAKRKGVYRPAVGLVAATPPPVEAVPVEEPAVDEGSGSSAARARRPRRSTAPSPDLAPAPTGTAAPRGPGRSGEHRRFPKAPLPDHGKGRPETLG